MRRSWARRCKNPSICGPLTTSVQDRVCARVGREKVAKAPRRPSEMQRAELAVARVASIRDEWRTSIDQDFRFCSLLEGVVPSTLRSAAGR